MYQFIFIVKERERPNFIRSRQKFDLFSVSPAIESVLLFVFLRQLYRALHSYPGIVRGKFLISTC